MDDADGGPLDPLARLETLQSVVAAALRMLNEIGRDPLLAHWLDAYRTMPVADRPVVVAAVVREVKAAVVTHGTGHVTGHGMHPTPHARLYVRSMGGELPRTDVETEAMRQATLRAIDVLGVLTNTPELLAQWRAATTTVLQEIDPVQRAAVETLTQEFVELLRRVPAADAPPAPALSSAPVPAPGATKTP